jgi:hypothetical protein
LLNASKKLKCKKAKKKTIEKITQICKNIALFGERYAKDSTFKRSEFLVDDLMTRLTTNLHLYV